MPGRGSVAVVTDSTACLAAETCRSRSITVVPLQVVVGSAAYDEGVPGGITAKALAEALAGKEPVSTSRPSPEQVLETYEKLARDGADEIVSVHLSGELSGTCESAQLAARKASVPVTVVDSRQVGMATGFSVLAAARAISSGADATGAAEAARAVATATTSLFYVDTLEHLRRGGRVGALGALVGSALAVKPILTVDQGRVSPLERVRTSARALSRMEELAVEAATALTASGADRVDVAVSHLAGLERAEELAGRLSERLAGELVDGREVVVGEISAVLGVHVGPGMVAVVVAPHPGD